MPSTPSDDGKSRSFGTCLNRMPFVYTLESSIFILDKPRIEQLTRQRKATLYTIDPHRN